MSAPPPPADPGTAPAVDSGSDEVLVTICKAADGGYTVYAGDEPDDGGEMAGAMGGPETAQGQPADSVGSALKLAMTILQADASSEGGPGSADEQMAGGFSASQSPTPVGSSPAQKY